MDSNNWVPPQPGGEPTMDTGDWRGQLAPESRQKIVNKIMETLKRHLPFSGPEGLNELRKIAVRFEEKIFSGSTSQTDYLRKISMKMITMESRSQNNLSNSAASVSSANNNQPQESASNLMQSQVQTQGQSVPMSLPPTQSQTPQQLLPQNIQGAPGSASMPSSMSSLTSNNMSAVLGQNPNIQNVLQNSSGSSMGQALATNLYGNSHRQMQGRQQVLSHQQQQQTQNSQYLYQQQLQQQHLKQNFPQGNLPNSLISSQMQQQPQSTLQPSQLQSSQQGVTTQTPSVMQPSLVHSASLSGLQPNPQLSIRQSLLRQQQQQSQHCAGVHHQQAPMSQQQQMMRQQASNGSMQQNQLIGQQNIVTDMQQSQQRLLGQHNSLPNLQQQQLMAQQNTLPTMHQQQLGPQSSVSGLQQQQQQQQMLGTQLGNSNMQSNPQQSVHMLSQSKFSLQQRAQQTGPSLLATQGQQSQPQATQQQTKPPIQAQSSQLQQQMGLQQSPNSLQHDLQQRLQAPGSVLQPPNVMDQQKQLYQAQRLQALPETSSTSLDSTAQTGNTGGGDWQEEVYQKIRSMKEMYLPELNEMYQKVATKLQQHESLPQQQRSDQLDKLKLFKTMLERMITFLSVSKNNILPALKDKLVQYEKQIVSFLNSNRPRRQLQQVQPAQTQMHSMQQPQSQITHVQSHDNQVNSPLQSVNIQGSVSKSLQSSMTSLQHNILSSLPGVSTAQQNSSNPMLGSSIDSGQGNALSPLQQVSMQQNPGSISQQANINSMSPQSGGSTVQPNSSTLQHQHLKQQQEQQMTLQLKQQLQQRQIQHQFLQKQQLLQQQQQQVRQQLPVQLHSQHMSQLHKMNDINELKIRQGMNIKPGMLQQHLATSQRSAYSSQQFKPGTQLPISSPQLIQGASPQMAQHPSPQVDQPNLSSINKAGTPLQSSNSPFVVPSPSTPLAPSPLPVDPEKHVAGTSSLSNTAYFGRQHTGSVQAPAQSLAIGTPGISASPLLQEFTSTDGIHVNNGPTTASGKSSVTDQPLERLIKAVGSVSSKALSSSVSDISSVVSMVDRIAGSAPGNGSRASVGEDLVAMTKCRLQARTAITQDGTMGTKKMKRFTTAIPMALNVTPSTGSISDNFKQLTGPEMSELESTATSRIKSPRIETNNALLEEIRDVNQRLIDTVVDISNEEVNPSALAVAPERDEGTIVKCSFTAVALSPNLKSYLASSQMSPIQPLRLLVPSNYPNCSPIPLDKFPVEISKEQEDLSTKAMSKFSIALRSLSQPVSLKDMARAWDACARIVISEYAQQYGGGTFSSKFGAWENVCTTQNGC